MWSATRNVDFAERVGLVAPDNEGGLASPDGVFALNAEPAEVQKLCW